MNTSSFLFRYGQYVAYAVTWLIHVVYLGTLVGRYGRLRQQREELDREK